MPAQSVATPVTPAAPSAPRSTPAAGRESDGASAQFGRQLDAARGQHGEAARLDGKQADASGTKDSAAQTDATDSSTAAAGEFAAAGAGLDPGGAAAKAQAERSGSEPARDAHDDDTDGLEQLAVPGLLPFLGAALPGAMAHRGILASSAGAQLSAHVAAAVTAGIADAARMLQLTAADAPAAEHASGTGLGVPQGLEAVLAAVRGPGGDEASAATGAMAAPNPTAAQLASLSAPAAGTHLLALAAPLGSDGFHQDLAQQVTWLAAQDVKQARIRVHPEDLGPIDLKVSVAHDHVDVVFSVQHPGTVQALQQSLPQLGQMLAQHGLSLGHAEVGQHGGNNPSTPHHQGAVGAVDDVADPHVPGAGIVAGTPNLLDAFA